MPHRVSIQVSAVPTVDRFFLAFVDRICLVNASAMNAAA